MKADSPTPNVDLEALRKLFPRRIHLEYTPEERLLTLTVTEMNRQLESDCGAFEGWVLLLHERALKCRIMLDVHLPATLSARCNQFFYRAHHFSQLIYDWFTLSPALAAQTAAFMERYHSSPKVYVYDHPDLPRGDKGENILLSRFSSEESVLYAMPECEGGQLYTRFPVTLYWGSSLKDATSANRIFPRTSGAGIDIWCVKENALHLFLLKYQTPKMSILSELFYCTRLLRDVLCKEEPEIRFISPRGETQLPYFEEFSSGSIQKLDAWFLCDGYHRLFDPLYFCDMVSTKSVRFHTLTYNCDMPVSVQTPLTEQQS